MRRSPYLILAILASVTMLTMYVEAMVIPSLPKIESALSATNEEAAWVVSAYLVVGAAVAPLFGKLGDVHGKKLLYIASLSLYTISVFLAGFSPSIYFLIAVRAVQGFGFSLFPLSLAIITDVFPRRMVATAQGIISAMVAIGMTVGMIAGAYIEEYLGWRAMFHIGSALSALLLILAYFVLERDRPISRERIDYMSTLILSLGTALFLIYLTETPYKGWTSPLQLAALTSGTALMAGYFLYSMRASNPLVPLGLLRRRNVMVANVAGFLSGVAMFSLFLGVIYYAEEPQPYGLGLSVIDAAFTLFPATLAMIVIAPLAGFATSGLGPKPVLIYGSAVASVGFILFSLFRLTPAQLVLDSFITGIGVVSVLIPIVNMIAVSMPPENVAVGLGFNTMVRFLGSSLGPVLAATYMSDYKYYVVYALSPLITAQLAGPPAFSMIFMTGLIFSVLTGLVSLFAMNYRPRSMGAVQAPA
ncbi:MAG: MFS transporter [Nitrososphaeria archaeon]